MLQSFFDIIIFGYIFLALTLIFFINRDRARPGAFFKRHWWLGAFSALVLTLGILLAVWIRFVEPNILVFKRQTIAFPKINRPIVIALISDPQVGNHKKADWIQKIVNKTLALKPDMLLIAGDLISNEDATNNFDESVFLEPLRKLVGELPIYYVLGNHEYGIGYRLPPKFSFKMPNRSDWVIKRMENIGIPLLKNELTCPLIKNQKLCIFGVDDIWGSSADYARLSKWDQTDPIILLSHNPDAILSWPTQLKKPDLFLAGHTHGGQMYLPFIGPLGNAEIALGKEHYRWLSYWNDIPMFVTVGNGESTAKLRLFTLPEIAVINLTP